MYPSNVGVECLKVIREKKSNPLNVFSFLFTHDSRKGLAMVV
jgi:hypothetical protein